eukprot:4826490-Karenia_brevis.AAC.1
MNYDIPFASSNQYIKAIAAIIVCHGNEMGRSDGKTTLKQLLLNIATFEKFQYFQNNARFIKLTANREAIPIGTTVNEALHRELKAFFSNVWSQTIRRLK